MSEINSLETKEEEKKEIIIPDFIDKEKTNMKITIIPKVKVNGTIPNKENIQKEKETPQGQENQNDQEQKIND